MDTRKIEHAEGQTRPGNPAPAQGDPLPQADLQHQIELRPTPARIVPRNKAKGTDLCGQSSYQYIIRSDLDCYLKALPFA